MTLTKSTINRAIRVLTAFVLAFSITNCSSPATSAPVEKEETEQPAPEETKETAPETELTDTITTPDEEVAQEETEEGTDGDENASSEEEADSPIVELSSEDYDPTFLSEDSLKMESIYSGMLEPIASLKTSDPKTYWFIVSWLNTAYKTPNWKGYDNYAEWRINAKQKGVDCSGFARVMGDRVFGKTIRGGSQGILDKQCTAITKSELTKGDLVFFKVPYSESNRIVHVGVYLMDDYFVHATSTGSSKKGRGLMINSLNEERWGAELVSGGKIKAN